MNVSASTVWYLYLVHQYINDIISCNWVWSFFKTYVLILQIFSRIKLKRNNKWISEIALYQFKTKTKEAANDDSSLSNIESNEFERLQKLIALCNKISHWTRTDCQGKLTFGTVTVFNSNRIVETGFYWWLNVLIHACTSCVRTAG